MTESNDQIRGLKRWLPHPMLTVVLILLWLSLVGRTEWGSILVAVVLGVVIPIITKNIWDVPPRISAVWRVAIYMAIVAWDVLVANVQVAWLILFRPPDQLRSRWITVPLDLESREAIAVLAGTVTLTPGTVSCDLSADGKSLLVHCLDAANEASAVAQIKGRYESRLKKIFP